ncbi:MAG: CRISPR-associated protein Cmr2 [Oscillatoria princeps RMCB-10]|jgi:CRISPR-associated protein Cmr2|nr:CRISPR-associated protein Cmr2 [Oscillatoria princeps RMCB-10]
MSASKYIFVTFAPIQGFIEKSRKLRDLYGASLILSYLSTEILKAAKKKNAEVISPGLPGVSKGMPNRILVKGHFPEEVAREALIEAWGKVLKQCRTYLEREIDEFLKGQGKKVYSYTWDTWEIEWDKWKNHTWELFWGEGDTPDEARENLERRKLSRRWTAINWIGDSSSISGADAIAYPRLEAKDIKFNSAGFSSGEKELVKDFYQTLAALFDGNSQWKQDTENFEVEGKFIAENERLSIPELVKRLVTHRDVGSPIGILPPENFNDIVRRARNTEQDIQGHWTGWFMGDGDRMGDHLKTLAQKSDGEIYKFSEIIRNWGKDFDHHFPRERGRVIYAGGDDFLGIIYSGRPEEPIAGRVAFEELIKVHQKWRNIQPDIQELLDKEVTISVGFVWVGAGVPQRDVLQHCREAQKRAKNRGRNRVTIRVVFNNGQYIEWTTPWEYLDILTHYRDLDGKDNWSHVYGDLAQLKARHAFGFGVNDLEDIDGVRIVDFLDGALEFLEIYFPTYKTKIDSAMEDIVGYANSDAKRRKELILWVENLINVGWHLLGDAPSDLSRASKEDGCV